MSEDYTRRQLLQTAERTPKEVISLLRDLQEWEIYLGGFEGAVWDKVRAFLKQCTKVDIERERMSTSKLPTKIPRGWYQLSNGEQVQLGDRFWLFASKRWQDVSVSDTAPSNCVGYAPAIDVPDIVIRKKETKKETKE